MLGSVVLLTDSITTWAFMHADSCDVSVITSNIRDQGL